MGRTVPPSAEIEARIEQLLAVGVGESPRGSVSELAKLGARLIIQRAVEVEFDAWLGRVRYERRSEDQRGLRNYESGLRNGFRSRRVQTAEGELEVEIPPRIVIDLPTAPLVGLKPVTDSVTVKLVPLVPVPAAVVTEISPAGAPLGTTALSCLVDTNGLGDSDLISDGYWN